MENYKSHYTTTDILETLGIKPYFLRFWESEFEQVQPITSESGQKLFTPKDLLLLKRIQMLLAKDQVPIQKAKSVIDRELADGTLEMMTQQPSQIVTELAPVVPQQIIETPDFSELFSHLQNMKESISQIKQDFL